MTSCCRSAFAVLVLLLSSAFARPQDEAYQPLVAVLEPWIAREAKLKEIPGLVVALVDDQRIVWALGFGKQDADHAATPRTVFKAGSISKPVTALLLMLLVQEGKLDLDAPLEKYLPGFAPKNGFDKKITLRQLAAHRSGLTRESPIGSYFDGTGPSLEDTIASLNGTELVYAPESKTSYSNAGFAAVGLAASKAAGEPFAKLIRRRVLDPIGMTSSGYEPRPDLANRLAKATMWSYFAKPFPAPTFELGTPPAGNLYASAEDLGKLVSFLFAEGKTAKGERLLTKESLDAMFRVAYAKPGDKAGFGIGWFVSQFEGRKRIGHNGAVYGFSSHLSALPGEKLGVVVLASKDVANGLTDLIGEVSLRGMLTLRLKGTPTPIPSSAPLDAKTIVDLAGVWRSGERELELRVEGAKLHAIPKAGGVRTEVRKLGAGFVFDDCLSYGPTFALVDGKLKIRDLVYERAKATIPEEAPAQWRGLLGEYGPDHNVLYVLERGGKLNVLIEWVFLYPLEEIGPDTFRFPDFGLYHGDKVVFRRDANGRVTQAIAANVPFARRTIPGESGKFRIEPVRPVAELRPASLEAKPPIEKNALLRKPDLVAVTDVDPSIKLDVRYASDDNFLGAPLYTSARAFLQRPAAEALARAHRRLEADGFGVLVHDAYRPWSVTKLFRDATPKAMHHFVADPSQGSRHNRGCAVDLTLYDRKTGQAVEMPSLYDEFSSRAFPNYWGGTSAQRWRRDLLRRAMEAEGFTVYEYEWWHFDHRDWRLYPILNQRFEDLGGAR